MRARGGNLVKPTGIRAALLRSGMGCFLFAVGVTALGVLTLPFARACYGYALLPTAISCGAALLLFVLLARAIGRMGEGQARRAARVAAPVFLAALFAVHLILGYLLEYTPSGDNFMLYNGSQMLARDGNFDAYPDFGLYLCRFSNQWGFLLMLTGFYRLLFALGIANTFFPLVLVQAALYTLGLSSALRMARRLRGARAELSLIALLLLCFPLYVAAAVLYTDTFSLPFVLLTLDFALRACDARTACGQLLWAVSCGACALIGSQIKMTVAIALIAAVIVWALTMRPLRALLCGALCALVMFSGMAAVRHVMLTRVLDPDVHAQQYTPPIHWVMMSIPTSDNPYGGATGDYGITWGMMDEGATREEIMDSIYTRIRDRVYTLRYPNRLIAAALRKNAALFGDGTFGMTEMLDDGPVRENAVSSVVLEGREYYGLYSAVASGIWIAQMLLAAAGCLRDIRRRDLRAALPCIALFGMMLFLMLWEARGRYIFSFVPVMLLLGALAMAGKAREDAP